MVQVAREMYWEKPWTIEGVDDKAIYLCIALMYDTGKRISNFTHKDGVEAEDH
jgi:hypothetical protein